VPRADSAGGACSSSQVRWCRKTREAYGTTIDWYTVGVLMYEFTHGALPFSQRDLPKPVYREPKAAAWPSPACKDLCEGLLVQDWHNRTACKGRGVLEIKEHAFFSDVPLMSTEPRRARAPPATPPVCAMWCAVEAPLVTRPSCARPWCGRWTGTL
jgi:hypothetical protein